jgi:ketosteroid isomerase-like protein
MKKHVLCFLFLFNGLFGFSQDRGLILKVLDLQRKAWNRGDLTAFMQGYWKSDSLLFVGKTAPTHGWQTTLEHYKKSYPDKATMGQLTFKIEKVDVLDATNGFVLGEWSLKRNKGDVAGYFTLWFKKINGVWVIVCDHTS